MVALQSVEAAKLERDQETYKGILLCICKIKSESLGRSQSGRVSVS